MAAAASSAVMLAGVAAAGVGWHTMPAANKVGNVACYSGLSIPVGGAAFATLPTGRNLASTSGSLFGDTFLVEHPSTVFRVAQASCSSTRQSSGLRAAVGTVTKEPATGIEFSNTLTELSFVGAGVREKKIAFLKVKVYAVGLYIDASSLADSSFLSSWKGKSGTELSKDEAFFKALIEVPVKKALNIVLARDVEGSQFWGALNEALTPRLKTAGVAGQQALESFGNVFNGLALKQGTTVLLTWVQPATLQVAVSSVGGSSNSATPNAPIATIESAALLSGIFDIYLGKDPASPSAAAAIANNFPSLL